MAVARSLRFESSHQRSTGAVSFDEKSVDAIFAEVDQSHSPGLAAGIAIEGRVVYRKGFGLATRELPVTLSPTMRMRIASMTKHFTCLAYLLLCEEGKADLDDPVRKYVPELHRVTHGVTMRQLMGHTSGLRDVHDISYQFSGTGHAVSSAQLLSLYRDIDDVNAPPGTTWNYNNGGYLILTAAIEKVLGEPLEEVFQRRIFDPLGMNSTLLRRLDTDFVSNSATAHMTDVDGKFEKSYLGTELTGEGGICSTVDDMLLWLAHMNEPTVGSPSTWDLMRTPLTLANGASTGYALGLIDGAYRGIRTLSHGGSLMGCNSYMLKAPDAGLDVVILVNRHDVNATLLANKVLDACLLKSGPSDGKTNGPFSLGTFLSAETGRLVQLFAKDGQQIAMMDGFEYPLVRDPQDILRPIPWLSFLKIAITLSGDRVKPTSIRLDDFGNPDHLMAVDPSSTSDIHQFCGRYRSDSTGTEVIVSQTEEGAVALSHGKFGSTSYRLESLADRIWRARYSGVMPWGGIVTFDSSGASLRFTSGRTTALSFRRLS